MGADVNVPKLRFPKFSTSWDDKIIGDIGQVRMCKRIFNEQTDIVGDIPFYKIGSFGKTADAFISRELYLDFRNKYPYPKKGDILISASGTIGRLVVYNGEEAYYQDSNIVWIENDEKFLTTEFLYYILTLSKFNTEGGTIQRLYNNILKSTKFKHPIIEEQTKIASFLTAVDDKLQALKKKKELLEQYKKGMMQQLFSQEIRFKKDDGTNYPDWEEKRLGDISTISTGSSNREDSILDGEFTFFDRSQDVRTSNRYLFDKEAIIVPGEGQAFIPKYFVGKFDLHQRTYAIFDFEDINGKYLFYSILYNDKHLLSQAVGSTVKSLRLPMFESMPIELPCEEEQTKIANFLSAIDDKITHCQSELDGLEQWKKGLLQQLFC